MRRDHQLFMPLWIRESFPPLRKQLRLFDYCRLTMLAEVWKNLTNLGEFDHPSLLSRARQLLCRHQNQIDPLAQTMFNSFIRSGR